MATLLTRKHHKQGGCYNPAPAHQGPIIAFKKIIAVTDTIAITMTISTGFNFMAGSLQGKMKAFGESQLSCFFGRQGNKSMRRYYIDKDFCKYEKLPLLLKNKALGGTAKRKPPSVQPHQSDGGVKVKSL